MSSHAQQDRIKAKGIFGTTEALVRKQLVQVYWDGLAVWTHKLAAPYFKRAFNLIFTEPKARDYVVKRIDCFNWRDVRGMPGLLSMHSFGMAWDINPETNPMTPRGEPMITDMPTEFADCFQVAGFLWGGHFGRRDPMHFELKEEFWGVDLKPYAISTDPPNTAGHSV